MRQINQYAAGNELLIISRMICMGMLAGLSVTDMRCRKISGSLLVLGSALAAVYLLLAGKGHVRLAAGGLLIGLGFVLVSRVTKEQLGYGDSWLFCILGVYLGTWNLLAVLSAAWLAAALAAMAVLAAHKYRRGTTLPMVPFIAVGYVTMWAGEILSWNV